MQKPIDSVVKVLNNICKYISSLFTKRVADFKRSKITQ